MTLPHIPFHAYRRRAERMRAYMAELGFDVLLATPSVNFRYLTGCEIPPSERLRALLFHREAIPTLVVPEFEREQILSIPIRTRMVTWRDGQDPFEAIRREVGDAPGITIGLEPRTDFGVYARLVRAVPEAQWVDGSAIFERLRCAKEEEEIDCLRAAAQITEQAFDKMPELVRDGIREIELAQRLVREMGSRGGEGSWAFVRFGENTAVPYCMPGNRSLAAGDPILADIGTRVGGYHSDVARVFAYRKAGGALKRLHDIVREAQDAAIGRVMPGAPVSEADAAARAVLHRHEHGPHCPLRIGHGIGLDRREPPYLVSGSRERLRPGMVLTIEPAIYLPERLGVRLEDQAVVTEEGARLLTTRTETLPVLS
ncbi:MAG: M24 family metallopeptidase [Candidatus Eisenbacteria bacterium]|nr:M24 family metallopeptidase [Candidatus Latescibacterota bacterium]MBD3301793.1 M24 family metallopeptidase [Candidatus Eisenbacteria bacterium]